MKLYFPTTSLNFNDIFATESISPSSFYNKRIFGTKRHFKTELNKDENYLVLFKTLPYFNLTECSVSEYEEYPIILSIEIDGNQLHNFIEIKENIYITDTTIYFNQNNVNVLFFSDEHKNKIIAKSTIVSETKTVNKYSSCFRVINKSKLQNFSEDINKLQFPEYKIMNQELSLFKDRFFNNIKGFYYGYISKKQSININEKFYYFTLSSKRVESINNIIKTNVQVKDRYVEIINDILQLSEKYALRSKKYSEDNYKTLFANLNLFTLSEKFEIDMIGSEFKDEHELKVFQIIVNTLLKNPKQICKDVLNTDLSFVINLIKEQIIEAFGTSSLYIDDMLFIDKRIVYSDFDIKIESINSNVLKNFLCFLLKYNNIDELERYIDLKCIPNSHIAYSFLGAFFGFADLSKIVTNNTANSECIELVKYVDNYLNSLKKNIDLVKSIPEAYNYNCYYLKTENTVSSSTNELSQHKGTDIDSITSTALITDSSIRKQLYIEICRIKQSKIVNKLLKLHNVKLEDTNYVNINIDNSNVELIFVFNNYPHKTIVLLGNKNNVKQDELLIFREELKNLGLNKSIGQGNYPAFKYFKMVEDKFEKLEFDDEKILLESLKLLK